MNQHQALSRDSGQQPTLKEGENILGLIATRNPQSVSEWAAIARHIPRELADKIFTDLDSERCWPNPEAPEHWPPRFRSLSWHPEFCQYRSEQLAKASIPEDESFDEFGASSFLVIKAAAFAVIAAEARLSP